MKDDVRLLKMQILLIKAGITVDKAEVLAKELAAIADMTPVIPYYPVCPPPDIYYPPPLPLQQQIYYGTDTTQ